MRTGVLFCVWDKLLEWSKEVFSLDGAIRHITSSLRLPLHLLWSHMSRGGRNALEWKQQRMSFSPWSYVEGKACITKWTDAHTHLFVVNLPLVSPLPIPASWNVRTHQLRGLSLTGWSLAWLPFFFNLPIRWRNTALYILKMAARGQMDVCRRKSLKSCQWDEHRDED